MVFHLCPHLPCVPRVQAGDTPPVQKRGPVRSFALSWVRRVENNQQKEQIMARNTNYKTPARLARRNPRHSSPGTSRRRAKTSPSGRASAQPGTTRTARASPCNSNWFRSQADASSSANRAKQPRRKARERLSFLLGELIRIKRRVRLLLI